MTKEEFQMTTINDEGNLYKYNATQYVSESEFDISITIDNVAFPNYITEGIQAQFSLKDLRNCSCRMEIIDKCNYTIKNLKNEIAYYAEEMKTVNYNRKCDIEIWISERLDSLNVYEYYLHNINLTDTNTDIDVIIDDVKYNARWINTHNYHNQIETLSDCRNENERIQKCKEIKDKNSKEIDKLYEQLESLKKQIIKKQNEEEVYSHYLSHKDKVCGEFCYETQRSKEWWSSYIETSNVSENVKIAWRKIYLSEDFLSGKIKCNFCEQVRQNDIISDEVILDGIIIPYYLLNSHKSINQLQKLKKLQTQEQRINYCKDIIQAYWKLKCYENEEIDWNDIKKLERQISIWNNRSSIDVCKHYVYQVLVEKN